MDKISMPNRKPRLMEWTIGGATAVVFVVVIGLIVTARVPDPVPEVQQEIKRVLTENTVSFEAFDVEWSFDEESGQNVVSTELMYKNADQSCTTHARITLVDVARLEEVTNWIEMPGHLKTTEAGQRLVLRRVYRTGATMDPGEYILTRSTWGFCETIAQLPTMLFAKFEVPPEATAGADQ